MKTRSNSIRRKISNTVLRWRVKHRDFTIVSPDCWGSSLYQELGIEYNMPFVGLFFYTPCYITLLQDFENLLGQEIIFVGQSKYEEANQYRSSKKHFYPIGLLGKNEVEIHFLHYENEAEAREKWNRRKARMNMQRLLVALSDRNLCAMEHLLTFERLPYHQKVIFTANSHPEISSSVWIKEFAGQEFIGNIYTRRASYRPYFDAANWLNGGTGKPSILYKVWNFFVNV